MELFRACSKKEILQILQGKTITLDPPGNFLGFSMSTSLGTAEGFLFDSSDYIIKYNNNLMKHLKHVSLVNRPTSWWMANEDWITHVSCFIDADKTLEEYCESELTDLDEVVFPKLKYIPNSISVIFTINQEIDKDIINQLRRLKINYISENKNLLIIKNL